MTSFKTLPFLMNEVRDFIKNSRKNSILIFFN